MTNDQKQTAPGIHPVLDRITLLFCERRCFRLILGSTWVCNHQDIETGQCLFRKLPPVRQNLIAIGAYQIDEWSICPIYGDSIVVSLIEKHFWVPPLICWTRNTRAEIAVSNSLSI